jgi:hypothetical protein
MHVELRHYSLDVGRSLNDVILEALTAWWNAHPTRGSYARLAKSGRTPVD